MTLASPPKSGTRPIYTEYATATADGRAADAATATAAASASMALFVGITLSSHVLAPARLRLFHERPLMRALPFMLADNEASGTTEDSIRNIELGVDDGSLPPGIASRVSFQTGGYKQAGQAEEIKILWDTFKKCYPTEELAEEAVNKNSAVILPNLNSPTKITGTHNLLLERFGPEETLEIITKNPGILVCTPGSLKDQSDDDIRNAANLVTTLESNKGLIKAWIGVSFVSFPMLIGWQIGRNKGWW